jgi:hypothetical protein
MRPLPLLCLLAACGPDLDGPCLERTERLDLDTVAELGFSGRDVLAFAEGDHRAELALSGAAPTGFVIGVAWDGSPPTWAERTPPRGEAVADAAMVAAEPVCQDRLSVPVRVTFRTADGALAEQWRGALDVEARDSARFGAALDLARLSGAFRPDLQRHVDARLHLDGAISAMEGTFGTVRMSAADPATRDRESWVIGAWTAR